ncbi:MAG: NAD-dependent epimerase/dehydratase family protein [Bacteroidetes bacterium]|nr:MAG: NAD-dependent epimerase/dehydratase family protein [Bacteroidota bacterium]
MQLLLTGATGFLGFRTLEKLIDLPSVSRIVATGRNLLAYRTIEHPKVSYRLGNLEDKEFVQTLAEGADVIINTASLSSPWGKRSDFEKANLQTQNNLLEAAKKNKVSRFIYISSPGIYYNGDDRLGVKESDPLPKKFVNQYARTKFEAEQMLQRSQLPYITLRPRALVGRGDSIIMPRLIRAFDEGRLRIIGDGKNIVDLTAVENVVDAIILSLSAGGESLHNAYNITNGKPVNLWDNISKVLAALDRHLGAKKVPFFIANNFAKILELKSRLTHQQEPTLTQYGVGTLAKSFTLDISKAQNLLGYSPKVSTEAAIDEFVNWYRHHEKL